MLYFFVKYLHIIAAVFLFGFGMGSYLYLIAAVRGRNPVVVAEVARLVVRFDTWVTTPAGVLQLASGLGMAYLAGWPLGSGWLRDALLIFAAVGLLWLPVLVLQGRLRHLAAAAAAAGQPLDEAFARQYRPWFWMGVAGFSGMFITVLLMVTKRSLGAWLGLG
ncbi:DUF2269 family protein [Pseudomonas sp. NPDC007930]|uniref:DUF2269 family protein n=1 Tax=Pseudomonas sp. NPDC007930 TaxID=3364417 RepID=UPI0036ECBFA4